MILIINSFILILAELAYKKSCCRLIMKQQWHWFPRITVWSRRGLPVGNHVSLCLNPLLRSNGARTSLSINTLIFEPETVHCITVIILQRVPEWLQPRGHLMLCNDYMLSLNRLCTLILFLPSHYQPCDLKYLKHCGPVFTYFLPYLKIIRWERH